MRFVFADKTRNIYETSLDTYNKLLQDNITKTYKRGSEDNISEINNELKHIARAVARALIRGGGVCSYIRVMTN